MSEVSTAGSTSMSEMVRAAEQFIEQSNEDVRPKRLKRYLKERFKISGEVSNEVAVSLIESGAPMSENKRYFLSPKVKETLGIVRGARHIEDFSIVLANNPEATVSMPSLEWFMMPGDRVQLRRCSQGYYVSQWLGFNQKRWCCRVLASYGKRVALIPVQAFAPIPITMDLPPELTAKQLQDKVVEVELNDSRVSIYSDEGLEGKFIRVVGQRFDPLGEMAIAQADHGIPVDFPQEVLDEASRFGEKVDGRSYAKRVDLRDIAFVTIDGEDARDFDDAVWASKTEDGWRLLVAIADVSHYVKPESALDVEAQRRGTSVYFPATVVPMLPEALSNGLCSLNPGVDRLTLVCDAVLDERAVVKAYQFYPAVIHSHARLTYTQVWAAIQGDVSAREQLGERLGDIETLYQLSKVLLERRKERHCLDFSTTELKALFDESGRIAGFEPRDINGANRLIEECMLVANVCAAEFVQMKKRETLYRIHEVPTPDKITSLNAQLRNFHLPKVNSEAETWTKVIEASKNKDYLQYMILRSMPRASYSPDNVGHFGLQYKAYAHFTSPIRRYPDLLMHRTIKSILARRRYQPKLLVDDAAVLDGYPVEGAKTSATSQGDKQAHATWEHLGLLCSNAERRADEATRDVMNYLKCDYVLRQNRIQPIQNVSARVTGVIEAGIFVTLPSLNVEGFVHVSELGWGYYEYDEATQTLTSDEEHRTYRIGDHVHVSLAEVDLDNRRMSFHLQYSESRRRPRSGRRRYYEDFWDFED